VTVGGEQKSLIKVCLENVATAVDNANRLLQDFKTMDNQSRWGVIQKLRRFFDESRFVLDQDNIVQFIDVVKSAEQSLQTALLTIGLQSSQSQYAEILHIHDAVQTLVCQNNDQFQVFCASLENSHRRCEQQGRSVGCWTIHTQRRTQPDRAPPRRTNSRNSVISTEQQVSPESPGMDGDANGNVHLNPGEYSSTLSEVAIEEDNGDGQSLLGSFLESESENDEHIAVIVTSEGELIEANPGRPADEEVDVDEQQVREVAIEPLIASDGSPDNVTDDEWQQCVSEVASTMDLDSKSAVQPLYDSMTVHVAPKADLFLDGTLSIRNCTSDSNSRLNFCVHTIVISEDDVATFMLKEPCDIGSCEHAKLDMLTGMAIPEALPLSCQVLLQTEHPGIPSGDRAEPETERLGFVVQMEGEIRCKQTMTIRSHISGRARMHPTIQCRFSTREILHFHNYGDTPISNDGDGVQNLAIESNHDSDNDGDNQSIVVASMSTIDSHSSGGDNQGSEQDFGTRSTSAHQDSLQTQKSEHSLGPYSRVPCFWCQNDALRPDFNAVSGSGWIFWTSESFGYKCNACGRRTWVNGISWGPSFPGGGAQLKGGFQ